jgi:hypothetical protein
MENTIMKNEKEACKKLGLSNLKQIDFYNLDGFRKIKTFVVFKHSSERDKIIEHFNKVEKKTHLTQRIQKNPPNVSESSTKISISR